MQHNKFTIKFDAPYKLHNDTYDKRSVLVVFGRSFAVNLDVLAGKSVCEIYMAGSCGDANSE